VARVHEQERSLTREIEHVVTEGLPGVEVLAVELSGPDRFTVFIDHPRGVDHALCERVTNLLRGYLDRYSVDVSSPGFDRPLRKQAHFRNVVGRKVSIRTGDAVAGKKRFRGELIAVDTTSVTVAAGDSLVHIPYEAIVRGNLVDEGGVR
jgi:ribosome maturation factor RimP